MWPTPMARGPGTIGAVIQSDLPTVHDLARYSLAVQHPAPWSGAAVPTA